MAKRNSTHLMRVLACACVLLFASSSTAQQSDAIHQIEVLLRTRGGQVGGVRVRLLRESRMQPITETYSRSDGQIRFSGLLPGDYIVETVESENLEATATRVEIIVPHVIFGKTTSQRVTVSIDIPPRKNVMLPPPGVLMADVDQNVPETAVRHYRKGLAEQRAGRSSAAKEFKAAVEAYPNYYAARLELGRELRTGKRFSEAAEALKPLGEIAPRRAESHIEYGLVLLALSRHSEAAIELRRALALEEANWMTHLNLGWALLEADAVEAESHFVRALELDEKKAAQAHLSLARLAHMRGMLQESIRHLAAYLKLAPDAADAPAVRKLLDQLRKSARH